MQNKGQETENKQKLRQSQQKNKSWKEQPIGESRKSLLYQCTKFTQSQKLSNILNTYWTSNTEYFING